MGVTAIPPDLSEEAYTALFDTADEFGDLLMIQRAVPWTKDLCLCKRLRIV